MYQMFAGATAFNGNLSMWNISSVTDMSSMFQSAESFNQDLCHWGDEFPYSSASDIFAESGCTFQAQPSLDRQGPFCASSFCPSYGQS